MDNSTLAVLIKEIGDEQGYEIDGTGNSFEIYLDKWNAVHFSISENTAGYLHVNQWEASPENEDGGFGRAVYSLRSASDVVQFCNILISSAALRAKRRE